jgi:hypothetical protein
MTKAMKKTDDPLAVVARKQHGLVTKREALGVLTRG